MKCDLLNAHELHCIIPSSNIDRTPSSVEANTSLSGSRALERLIMKPRALPDFFQSNELYRFDPIIQSIRDMAWYANELFLRFLCQ
jgi:hypothetical protein